jgi:outer membrane protein
VIVRGFFRVAVLSSALVSGSLFSSVAHAESLAEALRAAYNKNPTLRSDRARQRQTDELVPTAKSGWRPTITAGATAERKWSDTNVSPSDAQSSLNLNIQLSQPIFRGFRTVEGVKSAKSTVEAGRQQLLATEQAVLFQAIRAYLDVVRDRKVLSIRQRNVANLQKQARGAEQRFAVGEVTRTDVSQSRARVSGAQAEVASAKANLEASIASYEATIGRKPGTLKYARIGKLPSSLDGALATAQEINPKILAASWVFDASTHDVEVTKGDLLPVLSLRASASQTFEPQQGVDNAQSAAIQGVLTVPIYQGGSEYAAVRRAKQTASQRQIQVIEATRSVREQVSTAWYALRSTATTISSAKTQVSSSALALEGINQEYQVGSRTTIDVLNAEQELLNAQLGLINAEYSQHLASYQLLSAMGKLTARNLGLGGGYYDPTENYNNVKNKWIGLDADTVE